MISALLAYKTAGPKKEQHLRRLHNLLIRLKLHQLIRVARSHALPEDNIVLCHICFPRSSTIESVKERSDITHIEKQVLCIGLPESSAVDCCKRNKLLVRSE